jgi:hypothetical protein
MSGSNLRRWIVCFGEPIPLNSRETGRFTRLIVECCDPTMDEKLIKDAIGDAMKFPAGLSVRWGEFEPAEIIPPDFAPILAGENEHIKIWLVPDNS